MNCLPHYDSVMNYAFETEFPYSFYTPATVGSAQSEMISANPSAVHETDSWPGMAAARYEDQPYWLYTHTASNGVDWDRSGSILTSGPAVSAPLRLAHANGFVECRGFSEGRQILASGSDLVGTTDLTRVEHGGTDAIVAMWQRALTAGDAYGEIEYRSGPVGARSNGSCTGPDDLLLYHNNECLSFDTLRVLPGSPSDVLSFDIFWYQDELHVALIRSNNRLYGYRYRWDGASLLLESSEQIRSSTTGGVPELGVLYGGGTIPDRLIVAYKNGATGTPGEYRAYEWDAVGEDWDYLDTFPHSNGANGFDWNLRGVGSPSLAEWVDPGESSMPAGYRTTCGVFPDANSRLRPFCYDAANARWDDVADVVWPEAGTCSRNGEAPVPDSGQRCMLAAAGPPEFGFRYIRRSNNTPDNPYYGRGLFHLLVRTPQGDQPRTFLSTAAYGTDWHLRNVGFQFEDWRDYFRNRYTQIPVTARPSYYEDSQLGAGFSVQLNESDNEGRHVYFYPHADGTDNTTYYLGSDWRVMEDHICSSMDDTTTCGAINVYE